MGYYIRILGTQDPDLATTTLQEALKKAGLTAQLYTDDDEEGSEPLPVERWTMMDVANKKGEILARIERDTVVAGELGADELEEFRTQIRDAKPQSAVEWLDAYFDNIKVIYAFQLLNAAFEEDNYDIVSALRTAIWSRVGGLLQADNEGFSNDDGFHILWQFADTVSGDWYCAVLNEKGEWEKFRMDLGDAYQRMAFQAGNVPPAAIRL